MMEIKKIDLQGLSLLVDYLLQNLDKIENVINDFGEIIKDNGQGTIFLSPKNSSLKVFWIYQQKGRIESIGLGGPMLDLNLINIYGVYNNYEEGYSRFENEYIYVFFKSSHYTHTIKITSSEQLLHEKKIIKNIDIKGIEISFKR